MSISKPYNFTAGTKAKASEVNDNFDVLYNQVNQNTTSISDLFSATNSLNENKASNRGDTTKTFNVADPQIDYNAVNLRTMEKFIGPLKGLISGLTLSINTGNKVGVSAGSCYDSTFTVPMTLTTSSEIGVSGTETSARPLYLIANSDGSNVELSFSIGSGVYRNIGNVYTNSSGVIILVESFGTDPSTPSNPSSIIRDISPDYNNAISITLDKDGQLPSWTAEHSGWLTNNSAYSISVNPDTSGGQTPVANLPGNIIAFLNKGDIIYSTSNTATTYHFIRCRGEQ